MSRAVLAHIGCMTRKAITGRFAVLSIFVARMLCAAEAAIEMFHAEQFKCFRGTVKVIDG
jgi:hypothetical protein